MIPKAYVIVVEGATPDALNSVQSVVREKANRWWHRMATTWIVDDGLTAAEWRDLLKPVLTGTGANVLILRLPDAGQNRNWAYSGKAAKDRFEWLHDNYTERKSVVPDEKKDERQQGES
jgi:hypothetical protein